MFALTLFAGAAMAEEPSFEGSEEAGQTFEETETTLSAELGGAIAGGNTQFWTVNAFAVAGHKFDRNKLGAELGANFGKSIVDADGDGILSAPERDNGAQRTSQRGWAEGRYDRFLGERDSVYALVGGLHDEFAGYDLRTHEQVGYSRILVDSDTTGLVTEIGADLAQENYVAGVDPANAMILAGRAMVSFTQSLADNVAFSDTVEVYENVLDFQDLRLLNEAALTTKLSDMFSLKLSHQLIFDNVPVAGFQKTDHLGLVTLVASIL